MVNRPALYERARRSASRIVALVAPAGFGKSHLAHGIAAAATASPALEWDAALVPSADRVKRLRELWASAPAESVILFDSLEVVRDDPEAMALVAETIRARGGRTLILCARPPFPLLNTRLLPPGGYVHFGPDDLRFTAEDVRALIDVGETQAGEIIAVTGGWPIAVLALAEHAGAGELESALESLRAGTSPDLAEYINREIIGELDVELLSLLVAVQAVGSSGMTAIVHGTGRDDTSDALQLLARIVPISISESGSVAVHPLLSGFVERRFGEEIERQRAAAAVRSFAMRANSLAPAKLFAEVRRMREALPANADRTVLREFDGYLAFFALEAGQIDYAQILLAAHVETIHVIPSSREEAILIAAQGRLHAARYQTQQAAAYYERAFPYIEHPSIGAAIEASLAFMRLMQGDHEAEIAALNRALTLARRSGHQATVLEVLMHGVFCNWFTGDEMEYHRWFELLDAALGPAPFVDSIRFASVDPLEGRLNPRWRAFAALIVAGEQRDPSAIQETLRWARSEATLASDPLAELLTLLAYSIAAPEQRDELHGRINALSVQLAEPTLRESLESFFAGGDGSPMLNRFTRRYTRSASAAISGPGGATLRVNVFAGTVSRGEHIIKLSNRPLALVMTLAAIGSLSRERLCETLWPDADDVSAANTFKMCVRRTRQQLDDPSAIVYEKSLWSLREDIVVDIIEIERNLRAMPAAGILTSAHRAYFESIFEFLAGVRPAEIFNSEGMETIALRVGGVRHQIVTRLGESALANNDLDGALNYAEVLRRWDAADESSYTLSIRAYALAGNSAEAYRQYRHYCAQCERELGIKPQLPIEELLKQTAPR